MFLPAGFSVIWFTVFGTLGMCLDISVVKEAIKSTSTALFVVLQQYPLGTVLCAVMALLIFTFLVTASNSATIVAPQRVQVPHVEPMIMAVTPSSCKKGIISRAIRRASASVVPVPTVE